MNNYSFINTLKIALSILFLLCLLDWNYGYYQFVRFVGMVGFGVLAYQERAKKDKTWFVIWLVSALLINPFVKVALGRTIWNIIDVIWAVLLILSVYKDRIVKTQIKPSKTRDKFDFKDTTYKICISSDIIFYWINFSYFKHNFANDEEVYDTSIEGVPTFLKLQNSYTKNYDDLFDADYSKFETNTLFTIIWYGYRQELTAKTGAVKKFKSLEIEKIEVYEVNNEGNTELIEICDKKRLNSLGILY